MPRQLKRWLRYFISLALAVGILAVLIGKQKWETFSECVSGVRPWPLAAAASVAIAYWYVRVRRWRWMVALEGQTIGWPKAWISMLAGLGVGLITPMRSGEVVRPMFLPKGSRMRLAGWVIIEKMFDLSGVLTLCILGVFYMVFGGGVKLAGGESIPAWMLLAVPLLLAVALGGPLLLHYRPRRLWAFLSRILPRKARELAEARLSWRQFRIFFAYSLASTALSVLAVFMCLRAFGRIQLLDAAMLTPFVMLNNLLPATPGGFGVREGMAVLIFGAFGFTEEMVFAAYMSNALIVLVTPGAIGVVAAWIAGVASQLVPASQVTGPAESAHPERSNT